MKKLVLIVLWFTFGMPHFAFSQKSNPDKYVFSNKIFSFQFLLNLQSPGGDMAKTFGNHASIGFGGMLKGKKNWVYAAEGNYLFGGELKNLSIFDQLTNEAGYIPNNTGTPANYSVGLRGISFFIKAGRVFSFNRFRKNNGILYQSGIGFLQHKINIQTYQNEVPPLNENYVLGYDRLTNGFALNQFLGYQFYSQNRFINFYAGLDFTMAFTQNRRGFNYDSRQFDPLNKTDYLIAFRAGWLIPIYLHTKNEDEFQFR
jgi:hypothetical protein